MEDWVLLLVIRKHCRGHLQIKCEHCNQCCFVVDIKVSPRLRFKPRLVYAMTVGSSLSSCSWALDPSIQSMYLSRGLIEAYSLWDAMEISEWLTLAQLDSYLLIQHLFFYILGGDLLFQQVPMVKMDGLKLVQSKAILNYIAGKYNIYGKDLKERLL